VGVAQADPSRTASADTRPNRALFRWHRVWPQRPLRTPLRHFKSRDHAGSGEGWLVEGLLLQDPGATARLPTGARRHIQFLAPGSLGESVQSGQGCIEGGKLERNIEMKHVSDVEHPAMMRRKSPRRAFSNPLARTLADPRPRPIAPRRLRVAEAWQGCLPRTSLDRCDRRVWPDARGHRAGIA
jgi:hypothetical protein